MGFYAGIDLGKSSMVRKIHVGHTLKIRWIAEARTVPLFDRRQAYVWQWVRCAAKGRFRAVLGSPGGKIVPMMMLRPRQLLSIALAGWINRRQQQGIAYRRLAASRRGLAHGGDQGRRA